MPSMFSRNLFHPRNCLEIRAKITHLRFYSNKSLSNRCIVRPLSTSGEVTHRQQQTITPQTIDRHIDINFPFKYPNINYQYSDPIQLYLEPKKEGGTRILVLDLGTTGLNGTEDKITEIAIRDLNGGEKSVFHTLVNPEVVPVKNGKKIWILTEPSVPRMEEVIPRLVEWVRSRQVDSEPVILVAHNGHRFDFPFLVGAFYWYGYRVPQDWLFQDSLSIARQLCHPDGTKLQRGNHKLKDLVELFNVVAEASAHKSMEDVNALSFVLQKMTFELELTITDLRERASKSSRYYRAFY